MSIPTPTCDELVKLLSTICLAENVTINPYRLIDIINNCNRNVRLTLNTLEYIVETNRSILTLSDPINFNEVSSKHLYISNIVKELKVHNIDEIRDLLYNLLIHCIDPLDILKDIYYFIIYNHSISTESFIKLTELLAYYENTYRQGSKPIYHLEGFCVSIIHDSVLNLP